MCSPDDVSARSSKTWWSPLWQHEAASTRLREAGFGVSVVLPIGPVRSLTKRGFQPWLKAKARLSLGNAFWNNYSFASPIFHGPTPPPRFWTILHLQPQHPIWLHDEASTFHALHRNQKYMASCMLYLILSTHGKYKTAVGDHPSQEDPERQRTWRWVIFTMRWHSSNLPRGF